MSIHVYEAIQTVLISLCFVAMYVLLNRDMKTQQRQLEYVIFGCSIANLGMLVEYLAKADMSVALIGRAIQLMGSCVFTLSLLLLAGFICSIRISGVISGFLIVAGLVFSVFQFLDPYLGLFYLSKELVDDGKGFFLTTTPGIVGVIYCMVSIFFPIVASIIIMFYNAWKATNDVRKKDYFFISILFLLLFIAYGLNGIGLILPRYNLMIGLSTVIFLYLVFSKWKYQGIDVAAMTAQSALDAIAGGVITLNQYREILYYNDAARQMFPEITYCQGMSIEDLNIEFPDFSPGIETEMSLNNHRYHVSCSTIIDEQQKTYGYAILFNDVTEMLDLMEMIKEEQQRADEASQVKTMFLANISHEIRTPMNAIMGLSDLIIEESRGRKVYDMAVTIKKAANSLLALVNNVLDVSKLESGKMTLQEVNYSLDTLIRDTMKVMEIPAKQKGLQLKWNVDEKLPCLLFGDDGKIRQCLINLINNGLKFTDSGSVTVDVSGIIRGEKVALTFMIIDTGCGIKQEDLGRVFGQFEQVDKILNKNKEGSGLGLSITKQLVELMGGVVDVSSVYGEGTTFTIRLSQTVVNDMPISQIRDTVEQIEEEPNMFKAPDIQILIVDDNKVNLMVASGLIEPYGVQIDTAQSGYIALDLIKKKKYDVIMMDHMMPEMDGVETMKRIFEYYKADDYVPYTIALTANAYGEMHEMFLNNGFFDFISKPIEKNRLHQVLLKAIPDERRSFTEEVLKVEEYTEDDLAELFMEGIDVRAAFELHGCTQAEYLELLDLYYNEGLGKIKDIRMAYEKRDWENYRIFTHGLKSSSVNVGAVDLSENAKQHEFACKEEPVNEAFIDADIENLLRTYGEVLAEAKRVIDKQREKNNVADDTPMEVLEIDEIKVLVQEALDLSEDFQSKEAAEKIDKLLKYQLPKEIETKLSEIRMRFKLYDDDGAEELLEELIKELN